MITLAACTGDAAQKVMLSSEGGRNEEGTGREEGAVGLHLLHSKARKRLCI